jgi:uncharacterized protein (TIGR02147 family)
MAKREHQFTTFLKEEFENRKGRNSAYSVRAFSKFLEVNSSVISNIFNAKSNPSVKYIEKFGLKLGMPLRDIQKIAKSEQVGQIIKQDDKFKNYKQMTLDSYEMVSQWYNIAILYLRDENNFLYDSEVLSKKLNVSKQKITQALKMLERLSIIELIEKKYKVVSDAFYEHIDTTHTEEAARKFIKEILLKSIDALEEVPKTKRVHSTLTMSFKPEKLDDVKVFVEKFKKKFLTTFDEKSPEVEAYSLQLSFFPLSSDLETK